MPETVACPSCRSDIAIPADHVESSIRCGICWADVPLANRAAPTPASPSMPQSAPALAVARRPAAVIPGKPLPGMANLEERMQRAATKIAPAAAPVAAKPVVAAAVVSKPSAPLVEIQPQAAIAPVRVQQVTVDPPVAELVSDEPEERPSRPSRSRASSRRFQRDEDDDDYDDRPRRRPTKTKGKSPFPLIAGIGVFLLLLVGGVYLIARATRGTTDRDLVPVAEGDNPGMQFNLPNPDGNPPVGGAKAPPPFGFNPFPNLPNMQPPGANLALVAHAGDGYSAKVFARPLELPSILNLYDDNFIIAHARTKQVRSTSMPPSATIEITTADVPQGVTPDLKRIVADLAFRRGEAKEAKWAGHDGLEHVDDFAGRNTTTRIVRVGCRIFLAKFTIMNAFGDRKSAEEARKEFFDSFKITFDPETPAPVDPGLVPRRPVRPPNIPKPRPKLPGQP